MEKSIFCPGIVFAFGWWMFSPITWNGVMRETTVGFLTDPAPIFRLYNAAIETDVDELAVERRVTAMFEGQ